MNNLLFESILNNGTFNGLQLVIATITALTCGVVIAVSHMAKNKCTKSFLITLVLLPAIVELVIILVNGNIGAGVAVAGAFSLVRFRSIPGRGRDITSIFLAMATGLATGMGYIGVAIIFTVVLSSISFVISNLNWNNLDDNYMTLKITVPEDLDYEGVFDDIFKKYLTGYVYEEVKTSNMGSLYKLTISVIPKKSISTKSFIDEIRTRNGNLDIRLGRRIDEQDSL